MIVALGVLVKMARACLVILTDVASLFVISRVIFGRGPLLESSDAMNVYESYERVGEKNNVESYELKDRDPDSKPPYKFEGREPGPGHINMACGYKPDNLKHGLPINLPTGECDNTSRMRPYNEEMFMQTVQPGVYAYAQVNEPINSNIGISFNQQFNPTAAHVNDRGDGRVYAV